jgi:hypothetical protein
MTESDLPAFDKLIMDIYTFYGAECTKFALSIWRETAFEYDLPVVDWGLRQHMKNSERGQFLPKPADLSYQLRDVDFPGTGKVAI